MADFEFTLTLNRPPTDPELESLYEAGCDDATFGVISGVAYASFTRSAVTYEEAVDSATRNVESVAGLKVTEVTRDDE